MLADLQTKGCTSENDYSVKKMTTRSLYISAKVNHSAIFYVSHWSMRGEGMEVKVSGESGEGGLGASDIVCNFFFSTSPSSLLIGVVQEHDA